METQEFIKKIYKKRQQFFIFQKQVKISIRNFHQFSIKIASKNTSKQRRFFKNRPKKVHGNDVDFWLMEIKLKKVCRNDVDFWAIEIASNKIC